MKVNFWQILGLVIIIIGVVFAFRQKTAKNDTVQPPPAAGVSDTAPAIDTAPTTAPVAP